MNGRSTLFAAAGLGVALGVLARRRGGPAVGARVPLLNTSSAFGVGPDPRTLLQLWGVDFARFEPQAVVAVLPRVAPESVAWLLSGLTSGEVAQVRVVVEAHARRVAQEAVRARDRAACGCPPRG